MPKKILIFSLAYYPKHIGGAEVAIKEITDRLDPARYEFHVLCNRYDAMLPSEEQVGNVFVHRIGITTNNPSMGDLRKWPLHLNKIIYQWQAFREAKRLHSTHHFDGVWAMMAHATGVPAGRFKRAFPEVRYLLTLQEGDPPAYIEKKMRVFGSWFRDAFTQADCIQVISNFLGLWAKGMGYGGEPLLVPNAVDTAHFTQTYSKEVLQAVRDEFKVAATDTLLVTTSRLVPKNAVDDVIEALVHLPDSVKFIVFGTGPEEARLQALVAARGLTDRVQLRGQIGHAEMPKYLKACDIFIRPSRSEGMGNSFVEAMAAELPVIATQEGGIADFLFDAKRNPTLPATGFAVDANSPQQIATVVTHIMNSPVEVQATVARAKAMAIATYDWDLIANQMDVKVFTPLFQS